MFGGFPSNAVAGASALAPPATAVGAAVSPRPAFDAAAKDSECPRLLLSALPSSAGLLRVLSPPALWPRPRSDAGFGAVSPAGTSISDTAGGIDDNDDPFTVLS